MIIKGYKTPLTSADMWTLDRKNRSEELNEKFDKIWLPAVESSIERRNGDDSEHLNVGILCPLIKTFWPGLLLAGILKLIASLMTFVSPIVLDWILAFISDPNEPVWKGLIYASLMFIAPMIESVQYNQYEYIIISIAMRVKSCMISAIFKKGLKLSSLGKKEFSTGEIVNLMSVDTQRIVEYIMFVNILWSAPLQIGIALYLLWAQLGIATLAGIGVMIFTLPFNGYISSQLRKKQIIVMKEKDKRIRMMNEILNGIKVLKLYAWENSFKDYVMKFRSREMEYLVKQAWLNGGMMFVFGSAPFLVRILLLID
jgi:ABC-type bacteriocin/lantibiotic exporter with double-glycine peptidase domain